MSCPSADEGEERLRVALRPRQRQYGKELLARNFDSPGESTMKLEMKRNVAPLMHVPVRI